MKKTWKGLAEGTCVAGVFFVITLVLTFPVITTVTSELAGSGSDLYQTAANVLSTKERFEDLGVAGGIRESLLGFRFDPIALGAYASIVFGFPLGYNLFWLFSFIMSGLGMYFLVRFLLRESAPKATLAPLAAFFAGLVFAFSPTHIYWANGFRGATHIEWIPWTILFLLLIIERPTFLRFLGTFVFSVLLVTGEAHFVAFFLLFLVPFFWFYRQRIAAAFQSRRFRSYVFVFFGLSFIVALLHFAPLLSISRSENNYLDPGIDQTITYSNDLLGIVTPAYNQALLGDAFAPVRATFSGNQYKSPSYIGLTVLFLAMIAFWYRGARSGRFWLFLGLGFFVFSLGPVLHIGGTIEPSIPLPYIVLYKFVPFFENIRVVNRLIIFAILGFSIASSYGLFSLTQRYVRHGMLKRLLPILASGLVIVEYLTIPVPTTPLNHSPFYDQLRNDPGDFQILEIPAATNYKAASQSVFLQRIHRKSLANRYQFARKNKTDPAYVRSISVPILNELLYQLPRHTERFSHRAVDTTNPDANSAALNAQNVRYIVLSKLFIGTGPDDIRPDDFVRIRKFLRENLRSYEVYEDDQLIAYKIRPVAQGDFPSLQFGEGWSDVEHVGVSSFQWIKGQATLLIDPTDLSKSFSIQFDTRTTRNSVRSLTLSLNGAEIGRYYITPGARQFLLQLPTFQDGVNTLTFSSLNENGRMVNGLKAKTVQLANIRLSRADGGSVLSSSGNVQPLTRILEIPYRIPSLPENNEQYVVTPQQILEFYQRMMSGVAAVRTPILKDFFTDEQFSGRSLISNRDVFTEEYYNRQLRSMLGQLEIQQIVLRTELLTEEQIEKLTNFLSGTLGLQHLTGDARRIVFAVSNTVETPIVLSSLYGTWRQLTNPGQPRQVRNLTEESSMLISNPSNAPILAEFSFSARTCPKSDRQLRLVLNGSEINTVQVSARTFKHFSARIELPAGTQKLEFFPLDNALRPLSKEKLSRCGLTLTDVSLREVGVEEETATEGLSTEIR